MFDNFLLITIVIIAMWLGVLIYYLATSRRQKGLQESLENLKETLNKANRQE